MKHTSSAWLAAGLMLAGCGESAKEATPAAETAPETPAAAAFAPVTMPENVLGAAAFIEAPEANEGRVAITGAVYQVDTKKNRFLLCDQSEANCIGGD